MRVNITGIGIWTRGIRSWEEFLEVSKGTRGNADRSFETPSPDLIPARERRRAPLIVKLGVETLTQACTMAGLAQDAASSVFTSTLGDIGISDYICSTLTGENKLLSPTKFHNSVHNAPSGYWSISAGNQQPGSYVGGFLYSFPVALLEAVTMVVTEHEPVAVVATDVAHTNPFSDICQITESASIALMLEPDHTCSGWPAGFEVSRRNESRQAERWPAATPAAIQQLGESSPVARALAVLSVLASGDMRNITLPIDDHNCLHLAVEAPVENQA